MLQQRMILEIWKKPTAMAPTLESAPTPTPIPDPSNNNRKEEEENNFCNFAAIISLKRK
jgi:hypothetical protein